MRCERCEGWMIPHRFMDLRDDTGQVVFDGWRCLNCGVCLDAVILRHRSQRPTVAYRSKARRGRGHMRQSVGRSD